MLKKNCKIKSLLKSIEFNELKEKSNDLFLRESYTIKLDKCYGSGISFVISKIFLKFKKNLIFICDDREKAMHHVDDFEKIIGQDKVMFFPSLMNDFSRNNNSNNKDLNFRTEIVSKIKNKKNKNYIIVSYPEAICIKVANKSIFEKYSINLKKNLKISFDELIEKLFQFNFEKVNFVVNPGEFAVRGGIIDVYSYANQNPFRIDFFGEIIESIREFNVDNQLSSNEVSDAKIQAEENSILFKKNRINLIELFNKDGVIVYKNFDKLIHVCNEIFKKNKVPDKEDNIINYSSKNEFLKINEFGKKFIIDKSENFNLLKKINFGQVPQPSFNRNFNFLNKHLENDKKNRFKSYFFCSNKHQKIRLSEILNTEKKDLDYNFFDETIHEGFIDNKSKISYLTDHQIFNRYHSFKSNRFNKDESMKIKELIHLKLNDYVVHIDHGIGVFGGLKKIDVNNSTHETIKLIYADRDILYVNIHSLHKISKYNGKDGNVPKIYKLGSNSWKKVKEKTKTKVKKIAFDLIKLYAKRKEKKGFQFKSDSNLQIELEASFLFEETNDQIKSINEVKKDMESPQPMDRLICGDVGFGKTEIAIRAAFKAVDNNKQVAVLVPTTILSFQHFKTFTKRLKDFPITIEYLNRFKNIKEKREILINLKSGKIDILIGTHQLVSENVIFKDLGLLIVDEEQKFGVNVKEKLKSLKVNVDVLTLTATPIPRTLQFSLMNARDLSIINTPPANRYPILSEIIKFNNEKIKNAVLSEINRGGQVFFIHNKIENILDLKDYLEKLVPDINIRIGHGQMKGEELEKNLIDFIDGKFDVLIATTIIENGLDVPNANTIFINNSQNFGLSDLHQMRGRVGRSNKKAFCYFIIPGINSISKDAEKRINAIEQYSGLGSGIQIAMKDLEIRGAGNLLGAEQSGFINDVGFETYHKILKEAVNEIKEKEFEKLFEKEKFNKTEISDITIDFDIPILIPDNYINISTERMKIYKELSEIKSDYNLNLYKKNLTDRFGSFPKELDNLFEVIKLKWKFSKLGINKIILRKNICTAFFINKIDSFFENEEFSLLLNFLKKNNKIVQLIEKKINHKKRLLLKIEEVKKIKDLNNLFSELKIF